MAGTNIATSMASAETGLSFMTPYKELPLDVQNNILTMAVQALQKERDNLQLSNTQLTASNTQLTADVQRLSNDLVYERNRSRTLFDLSLIHI